MNISGATAAIKAFVDAVHGEVVSEAEITRRSRICDTCPKRQLIRTRVSKISRKLGLLANVHRVPSQVSDYSCGVCGCSLMLLLPATKADLHKDSPKEAAERPAGCWLKNA